MFTDTQTKTGRRIFRKVGRSLSLKHLAYAEEKPTICKLIPVGIRVIALTTINSLHQERYYSGIVAEAPKSLNKERYKMNYKMQTHFTYICCYYKLCKYRKYKLRGYVVTLNLFSS